MFYHKSLTCAGIKRTLSVRQANEYAMNKLNNNSELNIMNNQAPDVVGSCIPFVSEYTTCTEENKCSGCRKCQCNKDQEWVCKTVHMCGNDGGVNDQVLNNALGVLQSELTSMEEKKQLDAGSIQKSKPENLNQDSTLGDHQLAKLKTLLRMKRLASKTENKQKKIITEKINSKKHNMTLSANKHDVNKIKIDPLDTKKSVIAKNIKVISTKNNNNHIISANKTVISQNETSKFNHKEINKVHKKLYEPIHEINHTNTENKHAKRSIDTEKHNGSNDNHTIKFYETIDELNEDTLAKKNFNQTLQANRVNNVAKSARRSSSMNADKQSLHIDFNHPQEYNHIDNKIDHTDAKYDINLKLAQAHKGNYTLADKTKELSKLVVNELHKGSEIIGDPKAPIISNITFTPENDTLTAMAYIAGNLLNKLWNMENDGSRSSLETETMKQEKVADLLDLFKEPLNIRQELFLKNALAKLSSALQSEKDIRNVSLCADIEEAKRILSNDGALVNDVIENVKEEQNSYPKLNKENSKYATIRAVSKINNVLELIKKFESVQQDLHNLKNGVNVFKQNTPVSNLPYHKRVMDDNLSVNEKTSLNLYGNVLDKITKLLLPPKKYKKLAPRIKSHNILNSNDFIKQKFKDIYDIDLANLTVNAKDKLILDYLTHIDNNPNCLLNKRKARPELPSVPAIEGNILLNLSEFFKMKSFADLVNILGPNNHEVKKFLGIKSTTTTTTTQTPITRKTTSFATHEELRYYKDEVDKLSSTKNKLKLHLKNIIEDLLELQKANGNFPIRKLDIADALPCIYKIMNMDRTENKNEERIKTNPPNAKASVQKLKSVLSSEITRRTGSTSDNSPRPLSAAIWERIIKNIDQIYVPNYRRVLDTKEPKTLAEIKRMIKQVTNSSTHYKNEALLIEVPPSEKITLLKTFAKGIQQYVDVLEDIKLSFGHVNTLPVQEIEELMEFIKKAEFAIAQDHRILNNIEIVKTSRPLNNVESQAKSPDDTYKLQKPPAYIPSSDEVSISRKEVINQLIKNRMNLFLKTKQTKHTEQDVNYSIAQKILQYLESGNYDLAGELFRIISMQKKFEIPDKFKAATTTESYKEPYLGMMEMKHPLLQFGKPLLTDEINQDYLIKQLLNMKNMQS